MLSKLVELKLHKHLCSSDFWIMEKKSTSCFVICHIDYIVFTLEIIISNAIPLLDVCMKMVFIDFLLGLKKG